MNTISTNQIRRFPTQLALTAVAVIALLCAHTAFGGGGGGGSSSSSRGSVSFSSNTPSGTTGVTTNPNGTRTSFSTNCGGCAAGGGFSSGGGGGGGGGGGRATGGGGGQVVTVTQACNIITNPAVVELGTSTINLSWTPRPAGAMTLTRSGGGNSWATTLSPGSGTNSMNDAASFTAVGTVTYSLSFSGVSANTGGGSQGGSSNVTGVRSGASLIEAATQVGQGALGVSSHGAATPGGASGGYSGGTGNWGSGGGGTGGGGGGGGGGNWGSVGSAGGGGGAQTVTQTVYACTQTVRVVDKITECNDGSDNDGDGLINQQDPGCHTDGNPANTGSYDQTDNSESNPLPDLVPSLTAPSTVVAGLQVQVDARVKNNSTMYAPSNTFIVGWRNTSSVPSCGRRGRNCFTDNGTSFLRLGLLTNSFTGDQERTNGTTSFVPTTPGTYQVCAIADQNNDVREGTSGESNNRLCRTVIVTDPSAPAGPTITGPVTVDSTPSRVRKGTPSALVWNTGGRVQCSLTGSNGETIPVTTETGTAPTQNITAQTVYTLTCTDPGFEDDDTATVSILPLIQEI